MTTPLPKIMPYWIILGIILFLFLIIALAGYYMYRFAVVRDKKTPDYWNFPESLPMPHSLSEENAALITAGREFLLSHVGKPFYRVSRDGVTLACRMAHAENPRGIFLCCHGYRSHPLIDFPGAAQWIMEQGYSLCLIDERACGSSGGRHITFGVRESADITDWACWLYERYPDLPVILDGVSMGASAVLAAVGEPLPPNVRGVIADCGFSSPDAICKKVLRQWFHMPPFPIYYAAAFWIWLRTGVWLSDANMTRAVSRCRLPILIAHGTGDDFVPHAMGEAISAAAVNGSCEFFSVPDAPHGQSYLYDMSGYRAAILRLLQKAAL